MSLVPLALLALGMVLSSTAPILEAGAPDRLRNGQVHCERDFAPPALIDDLRADMAALVAAGLFNPAGSGGRSGEEDVLRLAEYCDPVGRPDRSIGDWEALFCLWERLDTVRQQLAAETGCPLLPEMELHYVRYPEGGFYGRHVDDYAQEAPAVPQALDSNEQGGRRAVSFICYLTPPGRPWSSADGGELRAFRGSRMEEADDVADECEDLEPNPGSLVLFDSCRVEHEVLPTNRPRDCLIGWFHVPRSTPLSALRGGWVPPAAIGPAPALGAAAAALSLRHRDPHASRRDRGTGPGGFGAAHPFSLPGSRLLHHSRAAARAPVAVMAEKPPPLDLSRAADLLELTFVRACMDLAKGDVTTLKLFIAAVVGGCRLGLPLPVLVAAIDDCESNTANRPLMPEERQLRESWISLVYLTLEIAEPAAATGDAAAGQAGAGAPGAGVHPGQTVDEARRREFVPFTQAVADRVGEGKALNQLALEDIAPTPAGQPRSAMQTAILSQSMRLVFLTFRVLAEEQEAAGKKVAQPFIPGTGPKRGDGMPAW